MPILVSNFFNLCPVSFFLKLKNSIILLLQVAVGALVRMICDSGQAVQAVIGQGAAVACAGIVSGKPSIAVNDILRMFPMPTRYRSAMAR